MTLSNWEITVLNSSLSASLGEKINSRGYYAVNHLEVLTTFHHRDAPSSKHDPVDASNIAKPRPSDLVEIAASPATSSVPIKVSS